MTTVAEISDYRPHRTAHVACIECAYDWVAVFPENTVALQCPSCDAPMGMPVKVDDKDWLRMFMGGGDNIGERLHVCFKAMRADAV